MESFDGREIVTIKQACEIVGVSRRTMYNWINAGKVQYIRTAGGHIRIFKFTLYETDSLVDLKVKQKANNGMCS